MRQLYQSVAHLVSDSGRMCNAPHSSVLFDGIPTLTGLEGDMWASQLLTLNTCTSSARITFDFTNPTDRCRLTNYTGVPYIEVLMFNFNFHARGIKTASSIGVTLSVFSISRLEVSYSCEFSVSVLSDDLVLQQNLPEFGQVLLMLLCLNKILQLVVLQ